MGVELETHKSSYDLALEAITSDKKRYRFLLALGYAKTILSVVVFAAVATPVAFFWVFVLMVPPSTPFVVTPGLQHAVSIVTASLAFLYGLIGPSPRSVVNAEIEKLRVAIFAKNMALAPKKPQ